MDLLAGTGCTSRKTNSVFTTHRSSEYLPTTLMKLEAIAEFSTPKLFAVCLELSHSFAYLSLP